MKHLPLKASFRARLTAVAVLSSVFALTISCVLLAGWQYTDARQRLEAQNRRVADVLASAASAPVVFHDKNAAREIITAALQNAAAIAILDDTGIPLAVGRKHGLKALPPAPAMEHNAQTSWHGPAMRIVIPIVVTGETVGWLDMTSEGESLSSLARRAAMVTAILLVIAAAAATLATRQLHPLVMRPLQQLLLTIEKVARSGNYSLRVPSSNDPQIDRVLAGFNGMIGEVERRDADLAKTMNALESARDVAEAANTAKSQFLAAMSHELRTPLNAVIAYAELVEEDLANENSPHVNDVKIINASARHLLLLINGVLDFARIESRQVSLDLHSFDLGELMQEVEATLRPLAARNGNRLRFDIQPSMRPVILDSMKLRQCLLNLGANACKFTQNGIITFKVWKTRDPDCVNVAISDTGVGMSDDLIGRLFIPFSQADASTTRRYGGTGLGLAITAEFIRLMSGNIQVSSEVGEGSTFTVVLPRRLPLGTSLPANLFDKGVSQ